MGDLLMVCKVDIQRYIGSQKAQANPSIGEEINCCADTLVIANDEALLERMLSSTSRAGIHT